MCPPNLCEVREENLPVPLPSRCEGVTQRYCHRSNFATPPAALSVFFSWGRRRLQGSFYFFWKVISRVSQENTVSSGLNCEANTDDRGVNPHFYYPPSIHRVP